MANPFHADFFKKNRQKLKGHIDQNAVAIFFSNHRMPRNGDQFFPFRQNSDLYYFTGIEAENTILVMEKYKNFLFIQKPDKTSALWEGETLSPEKAKDISGIENILWSHELESTMDKTLRSKKHIYLNVHEKMHSPGIQSKDEQYLKQTRKQYPFHAFYSVKPFMKQIRLIKEPEEIEAIKKAIAITGKALERIFPLVQPGISERQIKAEMLHELICNQSDGFAFEPIIAAGKNTTILHYTQNNNTCRNQELLLLDIGAEYNNYAADISRTIPVNGKYSPRQKACYQAVLEVMEKVKKDIRPGLTIKALNDKMVEQLIEKHIMLGLYQRKDLNSQPPPVWKKYFPHGVAHFIGLDVHDDGDQETTLDKGMIISWEPGIYIPEENIGIRIEDDILVDTPSVNLSSAIPKNIDEIETWMGRIPK